jgi:hypothetical protein
MVHPVPAIMTPFKTGAEVALSHAVPNGEIFALL